MVDLGFGENIVVYRKEKGWAGERISGVSLTVSDSRSATLRRDRTKSSRIDTGVVSTRSVHVLLKGEEERTIRPGDVIVWGQGDFPEVLSSPSQPKQEGWSSTVVQSVTDRRSGPLPHWELDGN